MKKYKNKIIAGVLIAIALAFAFWWGGDAPGLRGFNTDNEEKHTTVTVEPKASGTVSEKVPEESTEPEKTKVPQETAEAIKEPKTILPQSTNSPSAPDEMKNESETVTDEKSDESDGTEIKQDADKDKYDKAPVPEGRPAPIEPQDVTISDKELTCILSVRCDTILNNMSWLDPEKVELVPEDGIILSERTVTFYEGESVFNLLLREMKRNKIHMEFVNTPIYNSAYIEAINNLYEFDCGELSGWVYKVNDWFPNYGCSRYQLREGDKVEWLYTCNLGKDVGGYNF